MHWWAREYPVSASAEEVKVSQATAIQVYFWLRDVCSHRLCNIDPPIKLGGPGKVVATDESLFSQKCKVISHIKTLQKILCYLLSMVHAHASN